MTPESYQAKGPPAAPRAEVTAARIFVGIKIADDVARELADLARPLARHDVRLVPQDDIHLTLVPPWNDSEIDQAAAKLDGAVAGAREFSLAFIHLGYGPTPRYPRLLWVDCKAGEDLPLLRAALLDRFGRNEPRPFLPHVTLARIPRHGRTIACDHPLDRALSLMQEVTSVELFQSPPPGERGYRVLASSALCRRAAGTPAAETSSHDARATTRVKS